MKKEMFTRYYCRHACVYVHVCACWGCTKQMLGLNFISLYKYTIAKITSTKMNSYKFYTKGIQKKVY